MRETRNQIIDGAFVALCRRDWRQFLTKHFPFRPVGKGAEREGQRSVRTCPEAVPLAAGFGDGSGVPNIAKTG